MQQVEKEAFAIFAELAELEGDTLDAAIARRCGDNAELAGFVRRLFTADRGAATAQLDAGVAPVVTDAISETTARSSAQDSGSTSSSAPKSYRILRLIGEGGMGRVYEAEQSNPRRRVAIKAIRSTSASPAQRRRFEYEARILGTLQHPFIARLYESDVQIIDGEQRIYLAMELIRGKPIDQFVETGSLDSEQIVKLLLKVCEAVAYAHRMGVIHRDLKPANILVEEDGTPRVLDFGVARPVADSPLHTTFTEAGQIIGTLSYMSPEQLAGDGPADTRFDVYALGVLLFQMLTGRLPIDVRGQSIVQAARRIADEPVPSIRSIRPRLSADLDAICLMALAKNPAKRYGSVDALAEDLRRWLERRPVVARSSSHAYVLVTLARRHRRSIAAAMIAMLVVVGFAGYAASLAQQNHLQAQTLRRALYATNIGFAQSAMEGNDPLSVLPLLDSCPQDLRGWEWHYLKARSDQSLSTTLLAIDSMRYARRSADRNRVAVAGLDRTVAVYDLANDVKSPLFQMQFADGTPRIDISADGHLFIAAGHVDDIHLVDLRDGTTTKIQHPAPSGASRFERRVRAISLGADQRTLAVASQDGRLLVFDLNTRKIVHEIALEGEPHVVGVSSDAQFVYAGLRDGLIKCFDLKTGAPSRILAGHEATVGAMAFSQDGSILLTGDMVGNVFLWDTRTDELLWRKRLDNRWVTSLSLGPEQKTIVAGFADAGLVLIDRETRFVTGELRGHMRGVIETWFDDDRITSVSLDGTIRTWLAEPSLIAGKIESGQKDTLGVAFLPDSGSVLSSGTDGTIRRWDVRSQLPLSVFDRHEQSAYAVSLSANGRVLASSGRDRTIRIWDVASSRPVRTIRTDRGHLLSVSISPDGSKVIAGDVEGGVQLFDVATGQQLSTWTTSGRHTHAVRFHPDGNHFLTAGGDGIVRLYRTDLAEPLRTKALDQGILFDIALTPDATQIIIAGDGGVPTLLDFDTLDTVGTFPRHNGGVFGVAVHPDGSRFASCGIDRIIRVWDITSGRELLRLRGHQGLIHKVAFSPDGQHLVSTSDDGTLRLWSIAK